MFDRGKRRGIVIGLGAALALIATPTIAQAANLGGELHWTTQNSGAKEGANWSRSGSMRVCGDIVLSSSYADFGVQIMRDIQLSPDIKVVEKAGQYNYSWMCSSYVTGVQGNAYYTRSWWLQGEGSNWHNGYAQAES